MLDARPSAATQSSGMGAPAPAMSTPSSPIISVMTSSPRGFKAHAVDPAELNRKARCGGIRFEYPVIRHIHFLSDRFARMKDIGPQLPENTHAQHKIPPSSIAYSRSGIASPCSCAVVRSLQAVSRDTRCLPNRTAGERSLSQRYDRLGGPSKRHFFRH